MDGENRPKKTPVPREVRFGPYTLLKRIAVGGMAEIFLASRSDAQPDDVPFVIKRILPQLAEDESFVQMFVDEAQIVAHLEHPNVVRVFDFGEVAGQYYLAMEHVDGLDGWRLLRRFGRARRRMAPELAAFVCVEVLKGLAYVHEAKDASGVPLGIVHGDISPSNVYVSKAGEVKVGDFGIARARLRRSRAQEGTLTGKYGYMAPEQVLGRPFDHRADLFAVGVVLAELMTGEPLFTGASKLTLLLAVRDVRIEPLKKKSGEFPTGFMQALLKALSREPSDRFVHADDFRAALEEVLAASSRRATTEALGDAVRWALSVDRDAAAPSPSLLVETRAAPRGEETPAKTPTRRESRYRFREVEGTPTEPIDFARAIERVITGQLGLDTQVSVDGGPFVPVAEVEELARHLSAAVTATTAERVRTPAPGAMGDLSKTTVVSVLGRLILGNASGLVLFDFQSVRKEIYLVDGCPEFVASNLAGELLGEFLVSRRILTRGELDMALAVLPRFEGHLGETLIALGLVDAVQVVRYIADQVKAKLLELFRWRRGTYLFYQGALPPKSGVPLGLDPVDILCEGIRSGFSHTELEGWLSEHADREVVRARDREVPASLPPVQKRILDAITSPERLGDVPGRHPRAERGEVLRCLLLGYEAGLLVESRG